MPPGHNPREQPEPPFWIRDSRGRQHWIEETSQIPRDAQGWRPEGEADWRLLPAGNSRALSMP